MRRDLLAESPDYEFVLPEEGAHRYVDCLAIAKGAPNRDAAEDIHQLHPPSQKSA